MAEVQSMTVADVAARAGGDDLDELLRNAIAIFVRDLMEVRTLEWVGRAETW